MNPYVQRLIELYSQHANHEKAKWAKDYMRNQFDFLGIPSPLRRTLNKQFMKEHGVPAGSFLKKVVVACWELPEREYQYAALDLLLKNKETVTPDDMRWLEGLLVKKSWWDTIDVLSPHVIGSMLVRFSELIPGYPEKWINNENIWMQRSAILYQLYYKEKTDEERLYRYILHRANSDEFFVQKAIGWALRQYARTAPVSVKSFVLAHELKPLSRREALKHIG
ncbi:DNA alkylation repair protein [Heliobacterium gestii]|uniref:DNA alkylation repair protein n=1 Tax=Heliomicrobium gestii TaxID=2699 RepID=A0A845LES4_HELGE|nr:DNA alkylation repair protein [Heliomicrobium gestii]MBM7866260.1 3-methyladenine DNA glycosylase AlkD [Heliomicrobium gestii]MZP42945.1 DNA alkylation repair protein [Heliomicrobium gestii]